MNNKERLEEFRKFHVKMLLNSFYHPTTNGNPFYLSGLEITQMAEEIKEEGKKQLLALHEVMKKAGYNTKPLTNEITINYDEIINLPDNSISDPETIRQIALYGIKNNDNSLNNKIKKGLEFCGLYPHVMKMCYIQPELPIK